MSKIDQPVPWHGNTIIETHPEDPRQKRRLRRNVFHQGLGSIDEQRESGDSPRRDLLSL